MGKDAERGLNWMEMPVIATVARLLCRELTLQNEYLRLENRILKEKMLCMSDGDETPLSGS